jgi:GAF domain-containing protein
VLEALTGDATAPLESSQLYKSVEKALHDEAQLPGVTAALSSELQLDVLLDKIISITIVVLDADRSTLFLYDPRTNELWSQVAEGLDLKEIRIPADAAWRILKVGKTSLESQTVEAVLGPSQWVIDSLARVEPPASRI